MHGGVSGGGGGGRDHIKDPLEVGGEYNTIGKFSSLNGKFIGMLTVRVDPPTISFKNSDALASLISQRADKLIETGDRA